MRITEEERKKLKELAHRNKDEIDDHELTSRTKLALQRKFDYPEWALFFEVTGKNGKRADAIAYNLFPSRNFKTYGFEVKVSRSDWKKELEDGEKADFFVGQCDKWYVVAGRKGIVKESELPDGWGLLEMKGGGKLYEVVESEPTAHQNRPMDREFYARGIKKAAKKAREAQQQKKWEKKEAYREGKKEGQKLGEMDRETKRRLKKAEKLEWLEEQGISIWRKDEEKVQQTKDAMELIERLEEGTFRGLSDTISGLRGRKANLEDELDEIEKMVSELRSKVRGEKG